MTFTASELSYLGNQPIGRLATVRGDGSPQVSPVGFSYNEESGTIDIGGFNMSNSQKYHNVMHNDRVALVVDDLASRQPWRVRCLEIRGTAEVVPDPGPRRRAMTAHSSASGPDGSSASASSTPIRSRTS